MAGIRDLDEILQNLTVSRRPDVWTMVSVSDPVAVGGEVAAVISESEGTTVVATVAEAQRRGWPVDFRAAWLTLEVHSALDGVGLTATVSAALADQLIPANLLAGFFHDHLLVPVQQADEAMEAITALARSVDR